MAFGSEWDYERELALKNNGDAEKMLELYIYSHMKKKELHNVVKVFAKEANIETSQLMEIEENLLTEWWEVFWPTFCSSPSNKVEVKIVTEEKYMFHENERDPEEILHLYIYHYMKKRELHQTANIFAEEANIQISELLENDESFLKDWWEVFWLGFYSRMTKQPAGGNPESSAQPSMGEAQEMLFSLKRSQQLPITEDPPHVSNVVGQPPEVMWQAPQEMSQRRAEKRPMNIETSSILGHSASKEKGKGPLGFPLVKLLPSEITPVPYTGNFSHLQMPGTLQPPPQVIGASFQFESTNPAEQDSAYPPPALIAGESYRKDQGLLSGVGVNEADGPSRDSFSSQIPPAFLEFMQQVAEEWRTGDDAQTHLLTNPDSTNLDLRSAEVEFSSDTENLYFGL